MTDSNIRNTARDARLDVETATAWGLGRGGSDELSTFITNQEAAGQAQLVVSDRLPTKLNDYPRSDDSAYLALGFTFGEPDKGDPMFRPATLPQGWRKEKSDHSMWSHIVDQHGRKRVSIFYKAAFYDRDAFMQLVSARSYLQECRYDGKDPVLDDEWLSAATAKELLDEIAKDDERRATECDEHAKGRGSDDPYWGERAGEYRADAAKARALIEKLG